MEYIKLMLISMVPVIELRGTIPLGIAMDLNPIYVYLSCLIGSSIVSIPVVLVFRQVVDYLVYVADSKTNPDSIERLAALMGPATTQKKSLLQNSEHHY